MKDILYQGSFLDFFHKKKLHAQKNSGQEKFLCEKFPAKKFVGKTSNGLSKKKLLFLWMDDNFQTAVPVPGSQEKTFNRFL